MLAAYGGECATEETDNGVVRTASFYELRPGGQYVILAVKSIEAEDPLAADNLLFIDQAEALADGTLQLRMSSGRTPSRPTWSPAVPPTEILPTPRSSSPR